ncbi:hypothetical protein GUJ93_ZPchr0011g27113 [Zizania palustris]|uniref:Acid phosphatase n=1 Tax=Zizania palustris TaxID=103762 RepID=A0A8J5WLH3_ZIZPA|nr:hypothetical protein GUJ93_ZPchr0011g27113 [Zizania palustris]
MVARRHWSRSPSNDRSVAVEQIYVTRPPAAQLGPRGAHLERWAVRMGHHPEVDTLSGPNPKAGRAHASVLFFRPIPWCNHAFFSSIVEVTRSCHGGLLFPIKSTASGEAVPLAELGVRGRRRVPELARDGGGELNNARGWRTVPAPCVGYVTSYMTLGQYKRDLNSVMDQIAAYVDIIDADADADGLDAWVLDIDDTCLSNLLYYESKQFGAYDPSAFKMWASKGACPGICPVLELYDTLQYKGFKVFLLSGRDQETLATCTSQNLESEGFLGYERLIMRSPEYRGQSSSMFKSAMRKRLVEEDGYRIRGNVVGDQWSDLQIKPY